MNLYRIAVSIKHARHAGAALALAALSLAIGLGLGLSSPARADSPASRPSIPFMAVLSGHITSAPGGPCPAITGTVTGSGIATMFGPFTTAQTHCTDPNGSNPLGLSDGMFTYTNANGDTLSGTYGAQLRPTPTSSMDNLYLVYGEWTFEGGSGAFAGAAGGGAVTGVINVATGNGSVSLDGVLTLPASRSQ